MIYKLPYLIICFCLVVLFSPSIGAACDNPPILNYYSGSYYYSVQDAYDDAYNGDIILVRGAIFIEDLYFDMGKAVYIEFGYDCDFMSSFENVTLDGYMWVDNGAVYLLSNLTLAGDLWVSDGELYLLDVVLAGEMFIDNGNVSLL